MNGNMAETVWSAPGAMLVSCERKKRKTFKSGSNGKVEFGNGGAAAGAIASSSPVRIGTITLPWHRNGQATTTRGAFAVIVKTAGWK
jgi:hypothetical protein